MSGHTPGPWKPFIKNGVVAVMKGRAEVIKWTEANARLIAAAPDLLAKCKKIVAWLERLAEQSERGAKDERFKTLAEARAADAKNYRRTAADIHVSIDKAEGRS